MNPLFIHDWAERNPSRRWPVVGVLLMATILLGCAVEPDPLPLGEPTTEAEFRIHCREQFGPGVQIKRLSDGHLMCRRGKET